MTFETEDGVLTMLVDVVDSDGEWNGVDSAPVGTEECDRLIALYFSADSHTKDFDDYNAHVAETGTDPLDLYFTKDPIELRRLARGEMP